MKILMINSFHYMRGGGERCFFDLSELLVNHGHEVIPFSMHHPNNWPSDYEDTFVSHIDYPTEMQKPGLRPKLNVMERILYSREARDKLQALVDETRPDLAHIHGFIHEMSTSILPVLKRAGLPVTQTLHDYKLVCPNTTMVSHDSVCEACAGHRYYNMTRQRCKRGSLSASLLATAEMYFHEVFRLYEPNIDQFISPSRFLRDKMIEHGVRTPITVVPNFINPANFRPVYEADPYFVYAGRLVRVKGILTLLEAMRQLGDSVTLYVAGTGELEPELRAFVDTNGLENVQFLGHLPTEQLNGLVQRAMATVVPSEWYENYSMTVIESLACGTPVVGAAIGGIPEQVQHGHNGLLFEPGNAHDLAQKLQSMIVHPDIGLQMGRRARQQVEDVNGPATHYRQTMAVYDQLLGADMPVGQRLPVSA